MTRSNLRLCWWCAVGVLAEAGLYLSYRDKDARFHWFTHFLLGAGVALVVMAIAAWRTGRPVRFPLLWLVVGHLVAMFPDFLFQLGVAHERWMDVFLLHVSSHFVPGGNWTWLVAFLVALAAYLVTCDRLAASPRSASPPEFLAHLSTPP